MRQRTREDNSTVCYHKKQTGVSFSCVCPVIDNKFRHNIVKVVCRSTRLWPRGSTATLTMLWRNSWPIAGQTHEKLASICHIIKTGVNSSHNESTHCKSTISPKRMNFFHWLTKVHAHFYALHFTSGSDDELKVEKLSLLTCTSSKPLLWFVHVSMRLCCSQGSGHCLCCLHTVSFEELERTL